MDKKVENCPAKVPPGWNDPPDVVASSPQGSKPRRLLNKRVAFPITSTNNNPQSACLDNMLNDVLANFTNAVKDIEPCSSMLRDIDYVKNHWSDPNFSTKNKDLFLQASTFIRDKEIEKAEEIQFELSSDPSTAWFVLFLHTVITSLRNSNKK